MMPTFHELTTTQLKQALQFREQIESLQKKLDTLLGGTAPTAKTTQKSTTPRKKRTMSAAGRAKIAAAQKARWAKVKGKSSVKAPTKATPKRAGMSDERRAKLAASMKARWAARKKAAAASAA